MTLKDLFTGSWTWWSLFGDLVPPIIIAIIYFWAGVEWERFRSLRSDKKRLVKLEDQINEINSQKHQ
jgi:hypothetical protein